ncbi:MAG: hypothetical protein R6X16_04045 [Anaerolineae bacterium]
MLLRSYDPDRDQVAARRIWHEIGWLREGEAERKAMEIWVGAGNAHVAEVNGEAECLVLDARGAMRYQDTDLSYCGITGVATSRLVRKQGLATRLTALAIAERAALGDAVAGLGMFEQGFYNRLGMGTGSYDHSVTFDPSRLNIPGRPRIPQRLTADDSDRMHAARVGRRVSHGAVTMWSPALTRGEAVEGGEKAFGLGYSDGDGGALSHFMWVSADDLAHGPYSVAFYAHRTGRELLELLQVIKGLGDQVDRVRMLEPPGIVLQDFVRQPFSQYRVSRHTALETGVRASAWWQCRILDLQSCVGVMRPVEGDLHFNLDLQDPIAQYIADDAPWRGLTGRYILHLGEASTVEPGTDSALPTLTATVGAFTRLWLGVAPASGLALSDNLSGPDPLITALDRALCLPQPHIDWNM